MSPYELIARHVRTGVILDANLLLLYMVGKFDRNQIGRFKRTAIFTTDDFDLLEQIMSRVKRLVTTPGVLTEVTNLCDSILEPARTRFFGCLCDRIEVLDELYVPSLAAAQESEFVRLGLTDTTLLMLARHPLLIMTVDFELAGQLEKHRLPVVNFNHLRTFG